MDTPTTGLGSPLQPVRRGSFFPPAGIRASSGIAVALALIAGAVWLAGPSDGSAGPADSPRSPRYDEKFWSTWGDGNAELAGYDLTYTRYGEARRGTAVAIFVTETFAVDPRVKSEDPGRPLAETFPVIKLNLVQDFATGIYDYNLMTSAFVALADARVAQAGRPTKVAFSSQEWCGQVYSQLVFDLRSAAFSSHSYFDGEADEQLDLDWPPDGVAEDALLLWARGLAAPALGAGESRPVRLLRSLEVSRLTHVRPEWQGATLSRARETSSIEVPAGKFEVERLEARIEPSRSRPSYPPGKPPAARPGRRWTFWVERHEPHRIVRWERDDGSRAELLGSKRLQYWAMNSVGLEDQLRELGLRPRPSRTP